ncbi:YdcF family protein [Corynebacterium sp. A21]|uniref:YdcF family protein n=1 Tax=Corynebacterium sp. A21 TaxID=3457318 RepID=UPI003FD42347
MGNPGPGGRFRSLNRFSWLVGVVTLLVVSCLAVTAWFLYPPTVAPLRSDAVLVLAGASDGRHELGARLVEEGVADTLVISNWKGPEDAVGWSHCAGADRPAQDETLCMEPSPVTTVGEAQTFAELAAERNWDSVVVVTNRPHTRRVRTVFEQCATVDTTVVFHGWVSKPRIPSHVARELGGYLKFWVTGPCD